MAKVFPICAMVLVLSCCSGQRRLQRAYASDEVTVFLAGYRRAVLEHDEELILDRYIDPLYRREQLDELLEGRRRQFFDELFGLGQNRFADIVAMEFIGSDPCFEPLQYSPCPGAQGAQCPVVLMYEDGARVEDSVYLVRYPDGDRTFAVEGPRG